MSDPPTRVPTGGGSPLAETLGRGYQRVHRGCHLGARVLHAGDATPVRLGELVTDRRRVGAVLDGIGEDVGSTRRDVQASLFLEAYAWTLLLPLAGALVAERRVPLPPAAGVAVTLRDGLWPEVLLLGGSSFAALGDDASRTHPDAVLVDGDLVLTAMLGDRLVAHLGSPIRALAAFAGRAERALWRSVADRAATALLFAGETQGDVEEARKLAEALLSSPGPLHGRPDYRELPGPGGTMRVHVRSGCCLWWRTRARDPCLTCPLSPAEVRRAA